MARINVDIDLSNPVKRCTETIKNHPVSTETTELTVAKRTGSVHLPNVVIMIRELIVIKAKLIYEVSRHLLDLIVWKGLKDKTATIRAQWIVKQNQNI